MISPLVNLLMAWGISVKTKELGNKTEDMTGPVLICDLDCVQDQWVLHLHHGTKMQKSQYL
jgi:hypothetical protein